LAIGPNVILEDNNNKDLWKGVIIERLRIPDNRINNMGDDF